jgi:hypothetical protein
LRSGFRPLTLGAFLYLVWRYPHVWSGVLFCVAVFWLYKTMPAGRKFVRSTLFVLTALNIVVMRAVAFEAEILVWGVLAAGALLFYFLIEGIESDDAYYIGASGISFGVIAMVLHAGGGSISWHLIPVLFIALTVIAWESFSRGGIPLHRAVVGGATTGFIIIEVLWATLLLPLKMAVVSAFGTLLFITLLSLLKAHYRGVLRVRMVLQESAVVVLAGILALITARWG